MTAAAFDLSRAPGRFIEDLPELFRMWLDLNQPAVSAEELARLGEEDRKSKARRKRESLERRTYQRLRANSQLTGYERPRPLTRDEANANMVAVKILVPLTQKFGRKAGSGNCLTGRDRAVYELLTNMAHKLNGMVYPELKSIAKAVTGYENRVKQVVGSIKRLEAWGLIEHQRRYVEVPGVGHTRGPQVQQTSNFYRVLPIPAAVRTLVAKVWPKGKTSRAGASDHQRAAEREAGKGTPHQPLEGMSVRRAQQKLHQAAEGGAFSLGAGEADEAPTSPDPT